MPPPDATMGRRQFLLPLPSSPSTLVAMTSSDAIIGIIGGSGLYQIDGITDVEWRHVWSPFGDPSDELCCGRLGDTQVVFLPRHGRGHKIPPTEINFRANIDALKRSGVTDLISLSA